MVPASVSYAVCCPVSSVLRPPGGESLGRGGFSCRLTRCSAWQLRCESPAGWLSGLSRKVAEFMTG